MNKVIIIGTFLALLLSGCNSTQEKVEKTTKMEAQPVEKKESKEKVLENELTELQIFEQMVSESKFDDYITAIGIAKYSKHGLDVMLPLAQIDARMKLASQIKVTINSVQNNLIKEVQTNDTKQIGNVFTSVTSEVIDSLPLVGAKTNEMYTAKSGALFVHMVVRKTYVTNHLSDMRDSYKAHLQEQNLSNNSINEGMQLLDNIISKMNKKK